MIFALNALDLMLSFQSLTGFNVVFAIKQDFNTLLQKHFITVIISPSTFVKVCVKDYNLCPLCKKVVTYSKMRPKTSKILIPFLVLILIHSISLVQFSFYQEQVTSFTLVLH